VNNKKSYIIILIGIFLINPGEILSQDIKVNAFFDKQVAILNQQLTLTIEIKGTQSQPENVALPDFNKDFIVAGQTGTSTNMQIINGAMSVSISFGYALIPKHTGKITVPPIKVRIGGKEYLTKAIVLEVIKPTDVPKTDVKNQDDISVENLDDNLFVTAIPDKKVIYQNEGITISYKLFFNGVSINTYGIKKAPTTTGFWVEEYPMPRNPTVRREVVQGRQFQTAIIKQIELFPTKSGELDVEPLVVEFDIKAPNNRRRSRDVFDNFFNDSFFGRTVKKTFASSSVRIDVLPLPEENRPDNFTGLVGDYKISADLDKTEVKTNEAISLKIKVVGQGNIRLITEPEIELPADFEKYEPKTEEHIERNNNIISGYKTFEYVMIPRVQGTRKIKPILLSFFNPVLKRYVSVSTGELVINVLKGEETLLSGTPTNLTREEIKVLGTDVRFIKENVKKWSKTGDIFYRNPFYIIFMIIPMMAAAGSYMYRQHLERLDTDESYKKSRRAFGLAVKRLKKAKPQMKEGTINVFYSEISKAVQGYIADKLNLSEAGFISDEVKNILAHKQIEDEMVKRIFEFLQMCDFSRFAPSDNKTEDMGQAYNDAKDLIAILDKKLK